MRKLIFAACLVFISTSAFSLTLDFENPNSLGVTLGGNAYHDGRGGGHIWMADEWSNGYLSFGGATYLNAFQMNGLPWPDYPDGRTFLITVSAFDKYSNVVWSNAIDLSNNRSWDSWLTVDVNKPDVSSLTFYATAPSSVNVGFWPSVDNMVINESPSSPPTAATPEPGTMLLMGFGAAGAAWIKRKKMSHVV